MKSLIYISENLALEINVEFFLIRYDMFDGKSIENPIECAEDTIPRFEQSL